MRQATDSEGDTLTGGYFPHKCKCVLQREISSFSELLPHSLFVKINQPNIINNPKGAYFGVANSVPLHLLLGAKAQEAELSKLKHIPRPGGMCTNQIFCT